VIDTHYVPIGQDFRTAGLFVIGAAIAAFLILDLDFIHDPTLGVIVVAAAVLGGLVVARAPLRRQIDTLLDVDLSAGLIITTQPSHNGSGRGFVTHDVDEVDELLYALREAPIDPSKPGSVKVDAFALYIRLFSGELIPVVEACVDDARTFDVAKFLSEAFDVGIKQVGKGWRDG
jgi:hypothetical protein